MPRPRHPALLRPWPADPAGGGGKGQGGRALLRLLPVPHAAANCTMIFIPVCLQLLLPFVVHYF